MKKIFTLIIISCFIISCDNDANDIDPLDAEIVFEVDLDGTFTSAFVQDSVSAFLHAEQIIIKGFDANENTVSVLIDPANFSQGTEIVGTHEMGRTSAPTRAIVALAGGSAFFVSDSGSVTVTEYENNIMKGTFSFEATENNGSGQVSGMNGKFTAVITTQ